MIARADQPVRAWRIVKWDDRHSNHEQKRSGGRWIACPTRFDSIGLRVLLAQAGGVEAFGVYVLLAELAAKMPVPGVLANEQGPLDSQVIALVTGASKEAVDKAVEALRSPSIAWLDEVEWPVGPVTPVPAHREGVALGTLDGHDPAPASGGGGGRRPEDSGLNPERSGTDPDEPGETPRGVARNVPFSRGRAAGSSSRNESLQQQQQQPGARGETLPGPATGGGGGGFGEDAVTALLLRMGVPGRMLAGVAVGRWTTAQVVAHWAEVVRDSKVQKPGAVLATRLIDNQPAPRLTEDAVRRAIAQGVVTTISGESVSGRKLGFHPRGAYGPDVLRLDAERLEECVYA